MRSIIKLVRMKWKVRCISYLDDVLFLHKDKQKLEQITKEVMDWFFKLGLMVNKEKSELQAKQRFNFLGWKWDSIQSTVALNEERIASIVQKCHMVLINTMKRRPISVKKFASIVGQISAARFVHTDASLHMTNLYQCLMKNVNINGWNGLCRLHYGIIPELTFWISEVRKRKQRTLQSFGSPQVTITTDASPWACGGSVKISGQLKKIFHVPLNRVAQNQTSNFRELLAVKIALARFSQDIAKLSERKVLIRSDNTSVVYNINRWGAGKNLRPLLKEIRKLVESQGIQVKAVHIAGKRNVEADALSRLEQS
ncbi:uncharacterized protein MONOS_12957 [Monocercomonoides exilis]|uniref:uncharacterized protein n=1 Tax=Monocercomonoides exilis TaxID=2049356 RepID=UPI0035594D67|nr:hypothetical protein MONOS_12957 [Monocercomonoides exilis]|eukprot:MONOS_12957.1-p1 / transcript=MONOS_12957.1 / gene=MONOS_12957 / organism=Monocercomonoides_exilis_PA203 / gene_product=ORF3 / transcript_product=ORF3 / location=Mono_scaffold00759:14417-15352(-) / protein_length=311 / sequence_SO=supercontig / SO=protein_coding / is_pseudo=false